MTRWPSFAFTFSLLIVILENQYTTAVDNDEMLKDALEMIYQRQTELNPDQAVFLQQHQTYADAPLHNIRDRSEVKSPYQMFYNRNGVNNLNMEQFLDYDDEEKTPAKRNPSVFRERIDHSEHPPRQYPAQAFENPDEDTNDGELENELDYMNLLQNYWDKYKIMRKAAEQRHLNENSYGLYNYNQNGIPGRHYKRVPVSAWKSFPVSKRSSNAYPLQPSPAEKTDPKLESDLSHIFNEKKSEKSKTPKKVTNNGNEKKNNTKLERIKVAKQAKEQFVAKKENNKEKVITKKSVDWSNYFGLDKRSGNRDENLGIEKRSAKGLKLNNVDEDWLVNRYREHLAKINGDLGDDSGYIDAKQRRDEAKLDAIKHKLKNIEDMIIDEAIKYTGAHEGEALDSKEVQHIKDRVMSRLAAVYSLEKMRHALTEFKKSIAEQRQNLKPIDLSSEMDFDVDPENSGPLASSVRYNGDLEKKSEHDHNKDDNNVTLTAEKVLSGNFMKYILLIIGSACKFF